MSEIDNYRAQLQAKIDAIQKTEMEKQQAHSDHSQKLDLPTPDAQFISQHIEQPAGLSEAEIKMQAYNQQQQEWMANMDEMVARHSQQPDIPEMPEMTDRELDDEQWEKDFEANRQKAVQLEAEKEEQYLAEQKQQIDDQAEANRQAALATQAEQDKQLAAVNLEQAERSAPDDEISHNRALFEQAAARSNDHEIDVD